MVETVRCTSCGRRGGHWASGAVVNAIGCTGACLHWAIHKVDSPPFYTGGTGVWEFWDVSDEDCTCFELICSHVNARGCAMLTTLRCDETVGEGWSVDGWIALMQKRYEEFLSEASPDDIFARCPRLPGLYDTLLALHRQLEGLPALSLTLKVVMCSDAALLANTSTMSGNTLCQERLSMTSVIGDHVETVLRYLELPPGLPQADPRNPREPLGPHLPTPSKIGRHA